MVGRAWVVLLAGCAGDVEMRDSIPFDWPPAGPLPRGGLVVPESTGLTFLSLDGEVLSEPAWPQLVGPCPVCGGEGGSADGDGLLLSFTTGTPRQLSPGAVARVNGDGTLDWRVDGFGFPHDVIRDPADGSIIVVATFSSAVRWIPGDGSSNEPLRTLNSTDERFPQSPNGAELIVHEGRNYLLLSHRPESDGRLTMWDITTPGRPEFVWRYPRTGVIGVPHDPILRRYGGRWWLLYAHTRALPDNSGTVGIAVTDDPAVRPTYVADLQPGEDVGRFGFLRGIELLDDGTMIATDRGPASMGPVRLGRVFEARFPDPVPEASGRSGRLGDQLFLPLGETTLIEEGLGLPFEARFWPEDNQAD